ncbi:MAG: response regulator [Desertifilum sp. SIO1I2]|nr:response regulator [Desertifilum sp. SIO1I2]
MPEINGYQLIQRIRSRSPQQGGTLPAIALTAYAGESDRQSAIAAGFQLHLPKPLEVDRLIEAISNLLP